MKKLIALMLSIVLCLSFTLSFNAAENEVEIEKIEFNNQDFIKGMDISSLISLENSGVRFYDFDKNEADLLKILSQNGVNCVRVRIWNNPFDAEGNGYGGGNNDINTALKIAKRAAEYNLSVLLDFHYSDFWADPSKQKAPKAWEGLTLSEKAEAVKSFTESSLEKVRETGVNIAMVQIGNETNGGIAGVYTWAEMAEIFKAGSSAVRSFDKNIKIAVHFTNPEKTDYIKSLADFLDEYKVDYDVFALSYYPYWHGSLSNLTEVLNYTAATYDKYVMVAETSYANTLTDSDGHPNTVSSGSNDSGENLLWDFSVQGQAEEVRAVMNAVNNVENSKGLGVFYWEGAWISVGDLSALSGEEYMNKLGDNKLLWEKYGSGWASSYSAEYDPDDAGKWYGGSAVDNQAFFNSGGEALPSLRVFSLVDEKDEEVLIGDVNGDKKVNIPDVTLIQKFLAQLSKIYEKSADVDGDNAVTILDATHIQRYIAKIETELPIGKISS